MKISLIFVLILIITSSAFGANPWEKFEGCYETIKVNGQPVAEPTNFYKSKISYGTDIFFVTQSGQEFNSVTTAIVIKENGADTVIDLPLGFVDIPGALVTKTTMGVNFIFNGVVKFRRNNKLYPLNYSNEFLDLGNGRIFIKNSISKRFFELVKTPCP